MAVPVPKKKSGLSRSRFRKILSPEPQDFGSGPKSVRFWFKQTSGVGRTSEASSVKGMKNVKTCGKKMLCDPLCGSDIIKDSADFDMPWAIAGLATWQASAQFVDRCFEPYPKGKIKSKIKT